MEEIKEILGPEHVIFKITEELVDSDEDGDILEKIGSLIDSNGFPTAESLFTADSTSASSSANSASVVDLKDSWKINNNVDTEAYIDILLNNPSIIDHSIADSTINAMDLPVEFLPLQSNVKKSAELKILPVISKGNKVTLLQADKDLPVVPMVRHCENREENRENRENRESRGSRGSRENRENRESVEKNVEKESNPFTQKDEEVSNLPEILKSKDQKEIETIGWTDWIRSFVIYTDKKTSIRNKRKKDAEIKPSDYELSYDELKATTRNRSGLPRIFPNLAEDSGLYHVNTKEPKQIIFGGCAGMYHYFLGIASVLQEKFVMSDVVFGCVSGGSFPALALILDLPVRELHETWNKEILRELNKSSLKAFSRLNGIVFEKSKKYIPVDAHITAKNRLFISLTEFPSLKNHIVHYWQTIDSLLDCIQASCFIPIFDKRFWTIFDSTKYVDGGLSNNKPIPYPESPYIYITTNKWREIPLHWYWCYTSETWSDQLFEWGVSDTLAHLDEFSFLTPISKK